MQAQQRQSPPPEQATLWGTGALICSGRRLVRLAAMAVVLASGSSLAFRGRRRGGGGPQRFDQEKGNVVEVASFGGGRDDASNVTLTVNTRKKAITIINDNSNNSPEEGVDMYVDIEVTGTLPRCYSSPEADPSVGAWRQCAGGIDDSPVSMLLWPHPQQQYDFLQRCDTTWDTQHEDQGPRLYWDWTPESCSLETVSKEGFCRVMEGRKGILLVGDSLTRLATTTLASVLRARSILATSVKDVWKACDDKLTVRFMRNDYLDTRITSFANQQCLDGQGRRANNTRCTVFANNYTLEYFETLVVNSGAHPRSAEDYGRAMSVASEALTAAMKRLHGEQAILIVRNTTPGHWKCTARMFDEPVEEDVALQLISEAPDKYAWRFFDSFNAQLEEAFSARDGWKLLDAFSPTHLRADNHIGGSDCLHYCVPGPADHWITLLYNILLQAKEESDDLERRDGTRG